VQSLVITHLRTRLTLGSGNKGGEAFKVSKEGGFISWAVTPNRVRQGRQFV
jgi:hypothetical protein